MTNELTIVEPASSLAKASNDYFNKAVQYTLTSVNSMASKRVYLQTYAAWRAWCELVGGSPLTLNMETVHAYLLTMRTVKSTRQRHLSTLRKLSEILASMSQSPQYAAAHASLKLLKTPVEGCIESTRNKRALTPSQVEKIFGVWSEPSNQHIRNKAMLALMFLCGARRAEIVALKWSDLDLENGTLRILHGKGDKERISSIVGDYAIQNLLDWKSKHPEGREYVFCGLRVNDTLADDKPITANELYVIVKETGKRARVDFSPHDARRTLITEALNTGMPLAEVQNQAGHAQGATTLRYARSGDAKTRRQLFKLRYG